MRAQRFDLAIQIHGSGDIVNPLVSLFGARHCAGFREADDIGADPQWFLQWPTRGHEIERMLMLTDHLQLPRRGTRIDFPAEMEMEAWRARDTDALPAPYICLHAGSQLPSRRWPVERFAAVADALAARGWTIALTGVAAEAELAQTIRALVCRSHRSALIDFTGATTLWQLGALVAAAALVIANDTGISHIAAATATPSVIVSCGSDAARWAPLDTNLHRVLAADVPCRPCGYRDCPTAHECATM